MTSVTSLGIPGLSGQSAGLAPRRKTRQLKLGKVGVGSDHPMSVQSMTTSRSSTVGSRKSRKLLQRRASRSASA